MCAGKMLGYFQDLCVQHWEIYIKISCIMTTIWIVCMVCWQISLQSQFQMWQSLCLLQCNSQDKTQELGPPPHHHFFQIVSTRVESSKPNLFYTPHLSCCTLVFWFCRHQVVCNNFVQDVMHNNKFSFYKSLPDLKQFLKTLWVSMYRKKQGRLSVSRLRCHQIVPAGVWGVGVCIWDANSNGTKDDSNIIHTGRSAFSHAA